MLVLGAREERTGEVAVQSRKSGDEGSVSASRFVDKIQPEVRERERD